MQCRLGDDIFDVPELKRGKIFSLRWIQCECARGPESSYRETSYSDNESAEGRIAYEGNELGN
jgi:hypothetical protein